MNSTGGKYKKIEVSVHMVKSVAFRKRHVRLKRFFPGHRRAWREHTLVHNLDTSRSERNLGSIFTSSHDVFRQHFYTMETLFFFNFSLVNIKEDLQSFCWIFFSVPFRDLTYSSTYGTRVRTWAVFGGTRTRTWIFVVLVLEFQVLFEYFWKRWSVKFMSETRTKVSKFNAILKLVVRQI